MFTMTSTPEIQEYLKGSKHKNIKLLRYLGRNGIPEGAMPFGICWHLDKMGGNYNLVQVMFKQVRAQVPSTHNITAGYPIKDYDELGWPHRKEWCMFLAKVLDNPTKVYTIPKSLEDSLNVRSCAD